ncbi:polyprotein [Gossypium australe]|uniref:Polyprotein n=1 Tax=Gossypium australe TaxID=47621 RepID=A0A5B6U5F7_9ROSI|nr:polyprotein [Gossypium australe]
MGFAAISQPDNLLLERIQEGYSHDPTAKNFIKLANEGKTRRFWLQGDLLFTRGHRLYVPQYGNLRKEDMKECHDSRWVSHPGIHRAMALLEDRYYWPHMGDDVKTYETTCLISSYWVITTLAHFKTTMGDCTQGLYCWFA